MKLLRLKSDPMLLVGAMAAMVGVASACVGSDSSEIRRVAKLERVDPRAMVEIVAEPGAQPPRIRIEQPKVETMVMAEDVLTLEELVAPTMISLADHEAVVDESKSFDEFMDVGTAEMGAGNFQGAVANFRRALGSQVSSSEAWLELGRAYLRNDERARGVLCLEEAIERNVENAGAYALLSRVYLSTRDPGSAASYAKTLTRLQPKSFRGHFLLGRAYSQSEMWNEAIAAYEKSLEIDPGHIYANNNLGYAALQIGKYDMAVFAFEVATTQPKVKPFMLNSLGLAYERLGEPFNAMAAYDHALDVRPGYVKAIVNRTRLDGTFTEAQRDEYAAMIAVRGEREDEIASADTSDGADEETGAMAGGTLPDDETTVLGVADIDPPSFTEDIAEQP